MLFFTQLTLGKNAAPTSFPYPHLMGILVTKQQYGFLWKTFMEKEIKGLSSASGVPDIMPGMFDVPVLVPVRLLKMAFEIFRMIF